LEKNLGSFFSSEGARHVQPFYYYVPTFLGAFLPWSPFLPAAFAHGWRELRTPRREALIYLLIWFVFTFAFFSYAGSKLATYILLVFPPAALLVGLSWSDLMEGAARLRRSFSISALVFVLVAGTALGVTVATSAARFEGELGIPSWVFATFAAILVAGWGGAFLLLLARRPALSFALNTTTLLVGVLFAFATVGSTVGSFASCKAIVPELERRLAPGESIACFPDIVGVGDTALFYTGRLGLEIERGELRDYLASPERVYCLVDRLDRVDRFSDGYYLVYSEGRRFLISNQPDPP
jgi:4-amino-4-deoxy-L-arabinose transferase-like glycosyltransferase